LEVANIKGYRNCSVSFITPLFARHDKGTGKKIKPITPTTGRNIVAERVKQALGDKSQGHITPTPLDITLSRRY
jgi:hypothetical protein